MTSSSTHAFSSPSYPSLPCESRRRSPHHVQRNGGDIVPPCLVPVQVQRRFPTTAVAAAAAASHRPTLFSSLPQSRNGIDMSAFATVNTGSMPSIVSLSVGADATSRNGATAASLTTLVQPPTTWNTNASKRRKGRNRIQAGGKHSKQGVDNNNSCTINKSRKSTARATTTRDQKNGNVTSRNVANRKNNTYLPTSGNLPDPWHGAISMEHLRQHVQFRPLPTPAKAPQHLSDWEQVRQFRQDSWQWDALHPGRCTTSMAAAALGFLEPTVGQVLNIPPSWRHGAGRALARLRQPAIRTLDEMNALLLLNPPIDVDIMDDDDMKEGSKSSSVWRTPSTSRPSSTTSRSTTTTATNSVTTETTSSPTEAPAVQQEINVIEERPMFISDYIHQPSGQEMQRRKAYMKQRSWEFWTKAIRLYWGNTQEATAMLTALNYFSQKNTTTNGVTVTLVEVGLCGAGLDLNQSSSSNSASSSLLVGATPDGVLCYSDGRIEALEVKNHCPFFSNAGRKRRGGGKVKGGFSIGDRPMDQTGVMAQYVSQMQLEMLCLGPHCQSAVMVRQTATQGASIIRMHRDDDWIHEMLFFLHLFQRDYVEPNIKPPTDFFWQEQEHRAVAITKRYRRFVNRTAQLKGHIVANIPHNEIQRVHGPSPFFLDHV